MSEHSSIEWTDATWNPVRGCTKISAGCKHCYAETFAERWRGVPDHPYEQGFDLRLVPHKLLDPLIWRRPRRVFVNSMSDLFQEHVPAEYVGTALDVMRLADWHIYQVLTKRAGRMRELVEADHGDLADRRHIWLEGRSESQGVATRGAPPLRPRPCSPEPDRAGPAAT